MSELWVPIQSFRGSWVGGVRENLGLGLLSSQPQAPLEPAGLEERNASLPGPVLLGLSGLTTVFSVVEL